jgi:hypothetical protein
MSPRLTRLALRRNISVLHEALRRVAAHGSAFTIAVIGNRIDAEFMPGEVPPSVPRLFVRLFEQGLLLRVGHDSYALPALLELTKFVRRVQCTGRVSTTMRTSMPIAWSSRDISRRGSAMSSSAGNSRSSH